MLGLWVHWCTGAIYYLVVDVVCGWQTWFPDSCSITTLMWCQIKHSGRKKHSGNHIGCPYGLWCDTSASARSGLELVINGIY